MASALSIVLTSCGLAALSSPALAPSTVVHPPVAETIVTLPMAQDPVGAPAKDLGTQPGVVPAAALPAAHLGPMKHVWQSLNNCGPAAVVMALSTLGIDESQEVARLALRGPDPRRGMGPQGVGPWVEERFGLTTAWRTSGTNALIKQLVTNGFAPMVTQWMVDPEVQRVSHWRTVRGYDDSKSVFYVNDPMRGNNVALSYGWFAKNWQTFSYRWMVIYRPADEPLLRSIVGEHWNDRRMRELHYVRAKTEAAAEGTSAAWIAYGEAAYQFGLFEEAVAAIEKGLSLGSGTGIFMIRSSLPNALSALGRFDEADAARKRLANITPGVTPASAPAPTTFRLDPPIATIVAERERQESVRALAEERLLRSLERADRP